MTPASEGANRSRPSAIGLVTFDCYGTLVDWETGILNALREGYPGAREMADDALLREFHASQNALKMGSYRAYRGLLAEAARRLAAGRDWPEDPERAAGVAASLPSWRPFPDTNPALERLGRAGVRIGILSNIDDDLLSATLEQLAVDFDYLGTAERLRSYKPARPHFDLGRGWADASPGAWIHVAQSLFHDIEPATALRIPAVWVNRKGERPSQAARPLHETADVATAVDWILARSELPGA